MLRGEPQTVNAELASAYSEVLDENQPCAPGTLVARSKKHLAIACGEGWLKLSEVQLRRGKARPMPMAAALNGYPELFQLGKRCAT